MSALPFVVGLRHNMAEARCIPKVITVTANLDLKAETNVNMARYETRIDIEARLHVYQTISGVNPKPEELARAYDKAIKVLAHEMYGPIERDMRDLQVALFQVEQILPDDIHAKVNRIIKTLRGDG